MSSFSPVGALVTDAPLGISFVNGLAFGKPTDLEFKFGVHAGLSKYDQLDLILQNFESGQGSFRVQGPDGPNFVGMWIGAGRIRFYYIGNNEEVYREYHLRVPQSSGIKIPVKGIARQGHGLVVVLDTANGKESSHAIKSVQPVGSISAAGVAFDPAIAAENTTIFVTCVAEMNLLAGDMV